MDWSQFFPESVDWWHLLFAAVAIGAGWVTAHFARKGVLALASKLAGVGPSLAQLASRIVYYLIFLLGIGVALAFLGANVQPLLAMVVVLLVVVVLVLRGVADNFAAGVLIQTRNTVSVGDEIQVDTPDGAMTGTVVELNSRAVILLTLDGRTVHVPNALLLSEPLINDSTHGMRRSDVQVRITRDERSVAQLRELITTAAQSVPGVDHAHPARALTVTVEPDRLVARVQFWHAPLDRVPVTARVVDAVADALAAAGLHSTVTSDPGPPPLVPPPPV